MNTEHIFNFVSMFCVPPRLMFRVNEHDKTLSLSLSRLEEGGLLTDVKHGHLTQLQSEDVYFEALRFIEAIASAYDLGSTIVPGLERWLDGLDEETRTTALAYIKAIRYDVIRSIRFYLADERVQHFDVQHWENMFGKPMHVLVLGRSEFEPVYALAIYGDEFHEFTQPESIYYNLARLLPYEGSDEAVYAWKNVFEVVELRERYNSNLTTLSIEVDEKQCTDIVNRLMDIQDGDTAIDVFHEVMSPYCFPMGKQFVRLTFTFPYAYVGNAPAYALYIDGRWYVAYEPFMTVNGELYEELKKSGQWSLQLAPLEEVLPHLKPKTD